MAAHDPEAAVAFSDDVGRLPHAALAEVDCPLRAWWGEEDAVLSSLMSPDELARRSGVLVPRRMPISA